jgi:SAM-dependent methyltransferase
MNIETPGQKTAQLRKWYANNAADFEYATAIQSNKVFTKLTPEEQYRLNEFKLWFLEHGEVVSLQGKRILEFGCGHGRMAIETCGYDSYLGVDFCDELVCIGQKRIAQAGLSDRARLVTSECLAFEGPKEAFDIVCSLGMFEFVEYPEATLHHMCAHLKPGGVLFIDGHHSSPLYDLVRRWRWRRTLERGGIPKRGFTVAQLFSLFESVGLTDVQIWMKEYPFLGMLYARQGWRSVLELRNEMAKRPWLNVFATGFVAIGKKRI